MSCHRATPLSHGNYPIVLSDALMGKPGPKPLYTGVKYSPNPPPSTSTITSASLKPSTSDTKKYNLTFNAASTITYYQGTRQDGQNQKKAEGKYVLLFDEKNKRFVLHQLDTEFDMTFARSEPSAASPAVKAAAQPVQASATREKVGGKGLPKSIPTPRESSPEQGPRKPAQKSLPKKRPASDDEDEDSDPGFTIEYPEAKNPPVKKRAYGLGLGISPNSPLSMAHLSSASTGRVAGKSPLGYAGKSPAGYAGKSPAGTHSVRAGKSPASYAGKSPAGYAGKSPAGYAGKSPAMYGQKRSPPTAYAPQSPDFGNNDEDSDEEGEMEDVNIPQNPAQPHDEEEESDEDADHNPDVDPMTLDPGSPRGHGNARHDSSDDEGLEALMEKELLKGFRGGDDSSESEEE